MQSWLCLHGHIQRITVVHAAKTAAAHVYAYVSCWCLLQRLQLHMLMATALSLSFMKPDAAASLQLPYNSMEHTLSSTDLCMHAHDKETSSSSIAAVPTLISPVQASLSIEINLATCCFEALHQRALCTSSNPPTLNPPPVTAPSCIPFIGARATQLA